MGNEDSLVKKIAKKENGITKVNLRNKKMRQVRRIGGSINKVYIEINDKIFQSTMF